MRKRAMLIFLMKALHAQFLYYTGCFSFILKFNINNLFETSRWAEFMNLFSFMKPI